MSSVCDDIARLDKFSMRFLSFIDNFYPYKWEFYAIQSDVRNYSESSCDSHTICRTKNICHSGIITGKISNIDVAIVSSEDS